MTSQNQIVDISNWKYRYLQLSCRYP